MWLVDEEFHQHGIQRHMKAGKGWGINEHAAERTADEIAEKTFGEEVPYGRSGSRQSERRYTEYRRGNDCDLVFINAKRRIRVGEAVFGGLVQGITL